MKNGTVGGACRIPLRLLDTEASRVYLMALREARKAAIAMDGNGTV